MPGSCIRATEVQSDIEITVSARQLLGRKNEVHPERESLRLWLICAAPGNWLFFSRVSAKVFFPARKRAMFLFCGVFVVFFSGVFLCFLQEEPKFFIGWQHTPQLETGR